MNPIGLQPSEDVEYTISEDRAAGDALHAESGFELLASSSSATSQALPATQAKFDLADREMQLKLLEHQSRRRMMAAKHWERNHPSQHSIVDPRESIIQTKEHLDANQHEIANTNVATRTSPNADNMASDSEECSNVDNHEDFPLLYRVYCLEHHYKCDRRMFGDEPRRVLIDGQLHLAGDHFIDVGRLITSLSNRPFIVYRTFYCDNRELYSTQHSAASSEAHSAGYGVVSVLSTELHTALQKICKFAPNDGAYEPKPDSSFESPCMLKPPSPLLTLSTSEYTQYFFYHHRADIEQAAAEAACGEHLNHLLAYLQQHPDPMHTKCNDLFSRGLVTSETLAWLFRPNEIIVHREGKLLTAYVLRAVPMWSGPNTVELDCWTWGYDGKWFQRKDKILTVTCLSYSAIYITELSVYPLRYAEEQTRQQLHRTGSHFWKLRYQTHVAYEGPDYQGERVFPSDSRCMIDYETYHKFHEYADAFKFSNYRIVPFDNWPKKISVTTTLSPEETMLLPPGIHGFFLKDKKWVHLLVDNIRPVDWNKEAFEKLVLPRRTKHMVKALVLTRKAGLADSSDSLGIKGMRSDLIRGKGDGLIMLLHGGPGTGKTLTAESVAELAEMPLYNVTCGDIGTKPDVVEQYLDSVFHLGKRWNCVLLLDEADVFLEQRTLSGLKRNSLVSIFLRTLEYYSGVMILTSNRVKTFDTAFKSRIQVALHYPTLDQASRYQIWENFLDMLRADSVDADFEGIATHMDELAGQEMNGRQIRNAVTTARQLAMFEKTSLGWDHLEQAVAAVGDFDKHLDSDQRRPFEGDEWTVDTASRVARSELEVLSFYPGQNVD